MRDLFAVGLISILAQVIILRELSVAFYGVELIYVLGIGTWMLCSAGGALLGRAMPAVSGSTGLRACFLLLSASLPLDVLLSRSVRLIFGHVPGAFLPFDSQLAAMALVLLPVATLLGILFQGAAGAAVSDGATLARAYAVESVGGVFGGLIATGLLIAGVPNLPAAILCAVVALVAAEWRFSPTGYRPFALRPVPAFVAGALALALWFSAALDFRSALWTHPHLAETRDSPYGRVTVEQFGGQVSVFENDSLSFNSEGTESEEFVHLAALQHPGPQSVLVLGGGVQGIVREALLHRPRKLDDIELNPVLARVVQSRLPDRFREAERNPAVTVRIEDPRAYLRNAETRYDLILVGMPEPSSGQANRFYTREFFAECRSVMNDGGVLALRLASSENAWTPQIAQRMSSIYGALKSAFKDVVVIPGATDVLVASTGALCRDPDVLAMRLAARGFSPRLVSAPYLAYVLTNDRFAQVAGTLQKMSAPVNSDTRPVCYQYTSIIWLSKFFPRLAFPSAESTGTRTMAALGFVAAALGIVLVLGTRSIQVRGILVVGAAGFVGTVLEIVLILRYQVISGVLFQNLGILLMSFMAGLAAGASAVDADALPRVRRGPALACLGGVLAAGIAGELYAGIESGLVLTSVQLAAAGFFVAGVFAHASRSHAGDGPAGIAPLYAADLAGGCIGTLAGSLVLVPMLGLTAASLWMIPAALLIALLT